MTQILALLQNIAPLIEKTTLRQISQVMFGMLVASGRITMLGLSRWTEKGGSYRTIQRFYHTVLPWKALQWLFFQKHFLKPGDEHILVGDEVVVSKAGKATYGLDRFFAGVQQQVIPGLSFFAFALVKVCEEHSYPMQVTQTVKSAEEKAASKLKAEAKKAKKTAEKKKLGRPKGSKNKDKAEVVLNAELLRIQAALRSVLETVGTTLHLNYVALDGHFGNYPSAFMVRQEHLHLISKMRSDAALYTAFEGEHDGPGPKPKYWGLPNKVDTELRQVVIVAPLELIWGKIPQGRVATCAVVEAFDVSEDVGLGFNPGMVILKVDLLTFQGAEETLHRGVVITITCVTHADLHAVSRQQALVSHTGILTAAIRMMQQTCGRSAVLHGHLISLLHQDAFQGFVHRPTDDFPGEEIQDRRQIQPAFGCRDEGDVAQPFLIGGLGLEVSMQQIRRNRVRMLAVGSDFPLLFPPRPDIFDPHQACHPVFAHREASGHQLGMDPRTAIGLTALDMNVPGFTHQFLVGLRTFTHRPVSPGVVAAGGYFHHGAHPLNRKTVSMGIDEPKPQLLGCEKMTTTFFRISRSCFRISTSRRSRRSSSSRSMSFPLPGKACSSSWRN